jgi:predicted nicotinamide N-methyase
VLDHPELVAGRRVLDLASGSGIAAIAAAKAGAARVIAGDTDPCAVVAIVINADANGAVLEPTAIDLLSEDSGFDAASVDVVLAGDIFYHPEIGARAFRFLQRCRSAGALVLIGDPGRVHLPSQALTRRHADVVPVTRSVTYSAASTAEHSDHDLMAVSIWELPADCLPPEGHWRSGQNVDARAG